MNLNNRNIVNNGNNVNSMNEFHNFSRILFEIMEDFQQPSIIINYTPISTVNDNEYENNDEDENDNQNTNESENENDADDVNNNLNNIQNNNMDVSLNNTNNLQRFSYSNVILNALLGNSVMNDVVLNDVVVTDIDNENNFIDSIISNTLNDKKAYKNVISEEGKKSIKIIEYTRDDKFNPSCPITLVDFEEGEKVSVLPCNHCFNTNAIEIWLENEKAECPVCRLALNSKEIKDESNLSASSNRHRVTPSLVNLFGNLYSPFARQYVTNHNIRYSDSIHPYGPMRSREVIPHSYLTQSIMERQYDRDIELAILLSLSENNQQTSLNENNNENDDIV